MADDSELQRFADLVVARHITRRPEPDFSAIAEVVSGFGLTNTDVAKIRILATVRMEWISQMLTSPRLPDVEVDVITICPECRRRSESVRDFLCHPLMPSNDVNSDQQ